MAGNGVQGFTGPGKGINTKEQGDGKRLQELGENAVRRRARDVPYNQRADQPISGYKTAVANREDLTRLDSGGAAGVAAALERQTAAEETRVAGLQGLQNIADFTTMLPEDFQMFLQSQLVDPNGIVPGVGKVLVGSDHPFWDWAAKKEALKMSEEFEAFKFSQIDLTTPEARQFWESRHPELVQKLREGLRKDRLNRATLEDIALFGVQNEKDLWTLYEREKGFSRVPLGSGMETVQGYQTYLSRPLGLPLAPNTLKEFGYAVPANLQHSVAPQTGAWSLLTQVAEWIQGNPKPQGGLPLRNVG